MTSFRHLTRADLHQLTRAELSSRVAQESSHWKRLTAKQMDEQAVAAYLEFVGIAAAVHHPQGLATHLRNLIDGRDDNYLDETPGAACQDL
ncbi:hypothetical protein ABZY93_34950 [Streptomyces smyrnaeus]|uniref:hypothetical protein n=1 Tax=Streptomyces smyrnaeus TaxID=1387713 RepID=UPI0033B4936D